MRNLITLFDLTAAEIEQVLDRGVRIKADYDRGVREPLLQGRTLALLFQKPSLRTRVSFECGMAHMGGSSLFLGKDVGWGERESIADFAQVLGQFVDMIACRANAHERVI